MKKKLICLTLVFVTLLFGCSDTKKQSTVDTEALNKRVKAVNAETKLSGEYMLEITFSEGVTLYYAIGEMEWDRDAKTAFTEFSQSYLGISGETEN